MKAKIFSMLFLFFISIVQFGLFAQSKQLNLDQSFVKWHATKVTGEHYGKVKFASGNLDFEGDVLVGGTLNVDMNTISCDDIKDANTNGKLVGHLKSDDFFGVAANPNAVFTIIKAVPQGSGSYKVTGEITIKGKAKEVTTIAKVKNENGVFSGSASLELDRADFDIRYGSGSFFDNLGDNLIHDMFTLDISFKTN